MSAEVKKMVCSKICGSQEWFSAGRAKIRVGNDIVHVRFCSTTRPAPSKYRFNINPNTLSATYELWICGDADTYYLIPIDVIKGIYSDPEAYQDYHHPEIRVVSIDSDGHYVTYAVGARSLSIEPYLCAVLRG